MRPILATSHRFAAAVSAAGWVDNIDYYNRGDGNRGDGAQDYFEVGQGGIYATLWERTDLYLKSSPILCADRVTTPLLINTNPRDNPVLFYQGLAWFRALRRLGKRAWLLQYEGLAHQVEGAASQLDYTLRVTQFFDHYLKGAPAPKWMTEGASTRLEGIEAGLELDTPGKTPGPGLVGAKQQRQKPNPHALAMCRN